MSVFNVNNTEWTHGKYQLFLGEDPGLYDSIHTNYPQVFNQYKLQKSIDWSEDEVNLQQSRLDLLNCPRETYDIMLKNLAYQWELDSIAARSISTLFAPFVSNSELWAWYCKCTEMEVTHSLTYSEIIRQCIRDPQEALREAMENQNVINRSKAVSEAFQKVERTGAMLRLGMIQRNSPEAREAVILGVVALYCLERIEFMSSFAATFCLGEQGIFQGICKLVQKIAQDEIVHYTTGEMIIRELMKDPEWKQDFEQDVRISRILQEVYQQELDWNQYLFSEGRQVVGLTRGLLDLWVQYNAQDAFDLLGIDLPFDRVHSNPLPWMNNWLDINRVQNANQEGDNINYTLNTVVDDMSGMELDW